MPSPYTHTHVQSVQACFDMYEGHKISYNTTDNEVNCK